MKLPRRIRIGGQELDIVYQHDLEGNLGKCCLANGVIKIAMTFNGMEQSPSSMSNTFWHEVTHAILDTMGENDLSSNEKFVCGFAGFLTECVYSMGESYLEESLNEPDNTDGLVHKND